MKILYEGKCVDCDDVPGMEQHPDYPIGICREICGDGIRLQDSIHECDDGNTEDNDGCSSECVLEEGFKCNVPDKGTPYKTKCVPSDPIGFSVQFDTGR